LIFVQPLAKPKAKAKANDAQTASVKAAFVCNLAFDFTVTSFLFYITIQLPVNNN
jgi:hypothetical protein